jgi:hypothetical protein
MAVERFGDGLFKRSARDAFSRQPLEQHLTLVEKARSAVAALEGEVSDESFLQDREFAVLSVAFDGADRFAVKARRNLPAPWRSASASISAVQSCPSILKSACDQAQRLKPWAIAPVMPFFVCARAATAESASGESPGAVNCPSFQRAVCHCAARILQADAP